LFGDRRDWILFVQTEPTTSAAGATRLAMQYGFRHYCGSDGGLGSKPRGKIISSIINT
jgi:hypothetical protein